MMNKQTARVVLMACLVVVLAIVVAQPLSFGEAVTVNKDTVVAEVNGITIRQIDLDTVIEAFKSQATQKPTITPDVEAALLKSLIRRVLILNLPEVSELRKDDQIVKEVQAFEDKLVIRGFLEKTLGPAIQIEEDEIRKYYDENLEQFAVQQRVEASHILLREHEDATIALQRLRSGENFHALAKELSIDLPMALRGGSMGTIEKGKTLPAIENALFRLEEGEFREIVATDYGYHILTVDKIHTVNFKSYDEVKGDIKKMLIRINEARAFDKMASRLEHEADIRILRKDLQDAAARNEENGPSTNLSQKNDATFGHN